MASKGELRAQWESKKKQLAAIGMEMKHFNKNLGPALDAFEAAREEFLQSKNSKTEDALRKAIAPKAKAAGKIATEYLQLVNDLEKLCSGKDPKSKASKDALLAASFQLMAFNRELAKWV